MSIKIMVKEDNENTKYKFDYYYKDKYPIGCSSSCSSLKYNYEKNKPTLTINSQLNNFNNVLKKKHSYFVKYIQQYIQQNKPNIYKLNIVSSTGLAIFVNSKEDLSHLFDDTKGSINNVHFNIDKNNPELNNSIFIDNKCQKNLTLKKLYQLISNLNIKLDIYFDVYASYTLRYINDISCFINISFTITSIYIKNNNLLSSVINNSSQLEKYNYTHPKYICKYEKTSDLVDNIYNSLTKS